MVVAEFLSSDTFLSLPILKFTGFLGLGIEDDVAEVGG